MGGAVGLFSQGCCEGQVGFQWSLQRRPQLEAGVGAQGAALVRFWLGEGARGSEQLSVTMSSSGREGKPEL